MLTGTAVYGTVRTVVWEDGGGDPASYSIPLYSHISRTKSHIERIDIDTKFYN